jgi:hypothetical protein
MYLFAPSAELKLFFRTQINKDINKYISHTLASEVVEYVYAQSTESQRQEMVFSFYGNYFLLLKETEGSNNNKRFSLK